MSSEMTHLKIRKSARSKISICFDLQLNKTAQSWTYSFFLLLFSFDLKTDDLWKFLRTWFMLILNGMPYISFVDQSTHTHRHKTLIGVAMVWIIRFYYRGFYFFIEELHKDIIKACNRAVCTHMYVSRVYFSARILWIFDKSGEISD